MEDYKELVQRLNRHIMGDDYFNINSDFASAVVQAADAIERLVEERDAAIENIPKSCSKCAHSQDGYVRVLADGKTDDFCLTCVSNRRCNFKWRGVQE